jgi:hypothetical protein
VRHVGASPAGAQAEADVFVATPQMANQVGPTVRIALDEAGVRHDNAMLSAVLGEGGQLVYATAQHVALVELGIHRVLCRVATRPLIDITYCPGDRGVLYARTFVYGWRVHRLARPAVDRAQPPT